MENFKFVYNANFKHKRNAAIPFHSHDYFELVYYNSGSGTSFFGDTQPLHSFHFFKHTAILYPPHLSHNEIHDDDSNVNVFCFRCDNLKLPAKIIYDSSDRIFEIKEKILSEVKHLDVDYETYLESLITQILILIKRSENREPVERNQNLNSVITNIKNYINDHFYYDFNAETLTNMSYYSYDYIRHLFKSQFGKSPKQYLLEKRINYSKDLLASSDKSISEIATLSGFNSIAQFSLLFKKYTQLSPSDYRIKTKQLNNEIEKEI